MSIASALKINDKQIRTRSFILGGESFRVRVPLASEMEAINERVAEVDSTAKFNDMMQPLLDKREELESETIQFADDDAIVEGKSIKALAKLTAQTEQRITEMVRLLVPADDGFDMNAIGYAEINQEFPFAIQLELMKKIAEVISPGYEETRKN